MFPTGQSQSRGLNAASSHPKRVSLVPIIFSLWLVLCLRLVALLLQAVLGVVFFFGPFRVQLLGCGIEEKHVKVSVLYCLQRTIIS